MKKMMMVIVAAFLMGAAGCAGHRVKTAKPALIPPPTEAEARAWKNDFIQFLDTFNQARSNAALQDLVPTAQWLVAKSPPGKGYELSWKAYCLGAVGSDSPGSETCLEPGGPLAPPRGAPQPDSTCFEPDLRATLLESLRTGSEEAEQALVAISAHAFDCWEKNGRLGEVNKKLLKGGRRGYALTLLAQQEGLDVKMPSVDAVERALAGYLRPLKAGKLQVREREYGRIR